MACGWGTCTFSTLRVGILRAHRVRMHDATTQALVCKKSGCLFTTGDYGALVTHISRQPKAARGGGHAPPHADL
jgi:hypothetical protein